jgi:hypothetical protein
MVNGRITAEQMEWLETRAQELGGNLSAALRQTITDARFLEIARLDYKALRREHPDFTIPPHDDDGTTRSVDLILSLEASEATDLELRKEEAGDEG